MGIQVDRSDAEIFDLANWAEERVMHGETDHDDGTYEEGVRDAVRWLLGETDTRPDE
ncbi:hypothetical protein Q4508_12470 [Amphritea sp. 2_MG-2023]|uniref:hypothetical protein n=1 Tax=Amphritea TaxID=515417 RepID=UPI001C06FB7E|nr:MULTISPECIES: hypothetical protein [Amphritea]MBU2967081.1 hypothetical protein [Amphritea atlantica]MDO6419366.1 hypothetical protein [Amphritea sp. 2_MG-2023]